MARVLLLSDTHGVLDPRVAEAAEGCDEIWHAGDLGTWEVAEALQALRPLRAVHGNVDDASLRRAFPRDLRFECGGVDVLMTHISRSLRVEAPGIFVCGHSHLLKVVRKGKTLFLNPGACGNEGIHLVKTVLRLTLAEGAVRDLEVVEMGPRGSREGPLRVVRP